MALKSSRVVSSSSCPVTTTVPVTISCPSPTVVSPTAVFPTEIVSTGVAPTEVALTTGMDLSALLAQLGLGPTVTGAAAVTAGTTPQQICANPATQLGTLNPLAALAAVNLAAALAFLSPTLGIFDPAGAPTRAPASTKGPATPPFGKFWKWPIGI